mgnify:CR=1 FL=1
MQDVSPYAELACTSNFSFLTGASHPQELIARAAELGYAAIAITDECSLAGVVRALEESQRSAERGRPIQLIPGSSFRLQNGSRLVLLPEDHAGYTELCTLITRGRRHAPKGEYALPDDLLVLDKGAQAVQDAVVAYRRSDLGRAETLLREREAQISQLLDHRDRSPPSGRCRYMVAVRLSFYLSMKGSGFTVLGCFER